MHTKKGMSDPSLLPYSSFYYIIMEIVRIFSIINSYSTIEILFFNDTKGMITKRGAKFQVPLQYINYTKRWLSFSVCLSRVHL